MAICERVQKILLCEIGREYRSVLQSKGRNGLCTGSLQAQPWNDVVSKLPVRFTWLQPALGQTISSEKRRTPK
jgi:hypothetical protein